MGSFQERDERFGPHRAHASDLLDRVRRAFLRQRGERLHELGEGVVVANVHVRQRAREDVARLFFLSPEQTDERGAGDTRLLERTHAGARDEHVGRGDDVDERRVAGHPTGTTSEHLGHAAQREAARSARVFNERADRRVAVVRIQVHGSGAVTRHETTREGDERRQTHDLPRASASRELVRDVHALDRIERVHNLRERVREPTLHAKRPRRRRHGALQVVAMQVHDSRTGQRAVRGEQHGMKRIVDHKRSAAGHLAQRVHVIAHVGQRVLKETSARAAELQLVLVVELHAKSSRQRA